MATDVSPKMRSMLEFGAAIAILMGLTAMVAKKLESYVIQSQITEAFGLTATVRSDMIAYRAEHGDWPSSDNELGNSTLSEVSNVGKYVDHLELGKEGALTSVFGDDSAAAGLKGRRLTVRPLTLVANPSAPVSWVCGQHRYPSELSPGGVDETDVDPSDLPSTCREF